MIERKPFTPEDYRIGHAGVKGTSDYPTKGTAPRDTLHVSPLVGKERRTVVAHRRVSDSELLSPTLNPEEALIEAEDALQHEKDEEGDSEDVFDDVKNDSSEGAFDPMALHERRGGIDSTRLTVGPGAARQQEKKYPLRNWHNPRKHRGTFKPKGKKPEHLPKASSF